ncbi:MAG: hydroxyacid dehydrogenase [Anaerolineaceae bacterium]|nr:hydroxyacid dehydrogenase [Anaerolineaceae bacterium]
MAKPKVCITIGQMYYSRMISSAAMADLALFAEVIHHQGQKPAAKADLIDLLADADACITSWEVATLDEDVIAAAPKLKALVHLGGSVKGITSRALWDKGIKVFSARPALARDVAETTLGLMIIGIKNIVPLAQHVRSGGWRDSPYWPPRELHQTKVGIIGASQVGRHVIQLLKGFDADILLYDPYVSQEEASKLGTRKITLEEMAREADIISLHAPLLPGTRKILNAELLKMMKENCILINTARGGLIDEPALVSELQKGRLFAYLDVTEPEPPASDSPLRSLKNVVVLPHLAGCITDCSHLSVLAVEELRRFFTGEPLINEITPKMMDTIG